MNPDLFEAFAKILATSQKDQPCDILERFIKELSSTSCEASTWRLIQTLLKQSKENGTPLTQLAKLKDWIAKSSVEEGDISEQDEYELDQQVDSIVAPFTKRQRLSYEVHLSEATCRQQYLKIRTNDLRPMDSGSSEYSVMHYIVNEYINTNKAILDNKPSLPSTEMERRSWRECVCQLIKTKGLGRYGRLLYYTLSGNTDEFLNECKTWEDVIWVYYNSQVENCVALSSQDIFIPDQIASLALTKVTKNTTTRFFHQIKTAILSNKIMPMIDQLYGQWIARENRGLPPNKNHSIEQDQLRFIATLIIFGLNYLGWEENESMLGLLSAFINLNSRDGSFRPLAITTYCSLLSTQKSQIELYSTFLQNVGDVADSEDLKVIIKMAEKNRLDVDSMLTKIYENASKEALKKCPDLKDVSFKLDYITKANQDEQELLNALKWLRIKPALGLNQKGNELIRHFLSLGRIAVVEQVIQLLDCPEENVYCKETTSHIELVHVMKMLEQWRGTMERKPVELSNTSNVDLYMWKEEILELENTLSKNIKHILDGAWLDQDSLDSDKITNQELRQLYVPDLIINLHKVLYNHSSILLSPKHEASQLTSYITCERESLLKDIALANRMDDVLDELRKSL